MQAEGWPCEVFDESRIDSYQAVVFQKVYSEKDVALATLLKQRQAKVIFDLCDNHFYRLQQRNDTTKLRWLEAMMELADVVTVSTQALGDLIPRKGTIVVDDAVDDFRDASWRSRFVRSFGLRHHFLSNRARLVWFGNAGSKVPSYGLIDLAAIVPALNAVNNSTPISLTVISNSEVAFREHTGAAQFPVRFHQWDRRTFRAVFQQHQICLLPITKNPFTLCKSNNRILLSLLLGVPVIADTIPSYQEFAQWVAFSDWENNLRGILDHADESQARTREAAQYIREKYGPAHVVRQWSEVFDRVFARATRGGRFSLANSASASSATSC